MSANRIRLLNALQSPKSERQLLRAVIAVPLLSWLIFSALISGWLLSTSFGFAPALWYGSSTALLSAIVVFVTWVLLVSGRKGQPPPMPPLAGALRPIPIRPTPRLVRSAAELLPCERDRTA